MAKKQRYPLGTFMKEFGTEGKCREYLANLRWPDGFLCPKCGCHHACLLSNGRYQCAKCHHQTSVTAGTVLHRTHMPLTRWFLAFFFVSQDKRGISDVALMSMLGTTYKTAWNMLMCIRTAMGQRDKTHQLNGTIEFDDTYFGGPTVGKKRGRGTEKAKVLRLCLWMSGGILSIPRCRSRRMSNGPLSKSLPRPRLLRAVRSTAMATEAISRPWRTIPMSTSPMIPTPACSTGCTL